MSGGVTVPATANPVLASVEALPLPADDPGARWNLRAATAAWLGSRRSDHSHRAYFTTSPTG